jgi:chromosome partitioning protein
VHNAIAVMNTKGGVGKSTIVMGLAETLTAIYGKSVLVIDADAQASVSSMLLGTSELYVFQSGGNTVVEFLISSILEHQEPDWTKFAVRAKSDVDDVSSLYLMPGDVRLTLFEREIGGETQHVELRQCIGRLLEAARAAFDVVLIDCPPGLSVLTESWLREADWHLTPTKADYTSICGLDVFRRFKALNPEMGFAQNLGVLINMKEPMSLSDNEYHDMLQRDAANNCFETTIPRLNALQSAARHLPQTRSYMAKYPGEAGQVLKALAREVLARMAQPQVHSVEAVG